MTELMVIFVIALLVLGPKRLPELARSLGKGLAEFRRASGDMRREFLDVADDVRIRPSDLEPPQDDDDDEPDRDPRERPSLAPADAGTGTPTTAGAAAEPEREPSEDPKDG